LDIAVVDDEKAIREHICGLVEEQQPESRIEAYATGGGLLASGKRFDIVFLDIQMEGMNGIEAARSLRERREDTVLVFVTGIKDYVFDAFDLYAFQYLLKPIDEDKFAEVLERAVREAAKKKERRVLFIKSRNLTLYQSEMPEDGEFSEEQMDKYVSGVRVYEDRFEWLLNLSPDAGGGLDDAGSPVYFKKITVTPDDERAWFRKHPQWSKSNRYAELEAWIFI